jgi:hypothetical protein
MIGTIPVGMLMDVARDREPHGVGFMKETWPFCEVQALIIALDTFALGIAVWLPNLLTPAKS